MFPYKQAKQKRVIQKELARHLPKTNGIVLGLSGLDPDNAIESFKNEEIAKEYYLFETDKKVFKKLEGERKVIKLEDILALKQDKKRVPKEIRKHYIQYCIQEESFGRTKSDIAKELCISTPTLMNWIKEDRMFSVPQFENQKNQQNISANKNILTFAIDGTKQSDLVSILFKRLAEDGIEWKH